MANPVDIQTYLGGVTYPCDKQTLIKYAQDKGADGKVLHTLRGLPNREYTSPIDVSSEISDEEGIESDESG
ncbi:MAG: DUF2795 domain-containing protein [Parcubacteria group bacterium]